VQFVSRRRNQTHSFKIITAVAKVGQCTPLKPKIPPRRLYQTVSNSGNIFLGVENLAVFSHHFLGALEKKWK
jgi:hypothetical protein